METSHLYAGLVLAFVTAAVGIFWRRGLLKTIKSVGRVKSSSSENTPISVNYHFTRQCNYSCGFCFHTALTSHVMSEEEAKRGLRLLKEAGMRKVNFAGGEPFLEPKFLGVLVKYCKEELQLESVSIVSNASKIQAAWFETYGSFLDILAVSVDSFDEATNEKIGRGKGKHLDGIRKAASLCKEHGVKFKINTVVNAYNHEEDMSIPINELNPCRWKVFQVLKIEGENSGDGAKRNVDDFLITSEAFDAFLTRHKDIKSLVPESNDTMKNSYLILDEHMRFLNCQEGRKDPSPSILQVGVKEALRHAGFDREKFVERKGEYDWNRNLSSNECASGANIDPNLAW